MKFKKVVIKGFMLPTKFGLVATEALAHTVFGLPDVLLTTVGAVKAINYACALAVEGGVYAVDCVVMTGDDVRELSEDWANEASGVGACGVL